MATDARKTCRSVFLMAASSFVLVSGCFPGASSQLRTPEAARFESALHSYKEFLFHRQSDPEQEQALYSILLRDGPSHAQIIFSAIEESGRNASFSEHLYSLLMEIGTEEAVAYVIQAYSASEAPSERMFLHMLLQLYFNVTVPRDRHEAAVERFRRVFERRYSRKKVDGGR